jgi:serine/threonine protein kinase
MSKDGVLGKHGRASPNLSVLINNNNDNNNGYNSNNEFRRPKGLGPLTFIGNSNNNNNSNIYKQQESANIIPLKITRPNGTPKSVIRKSAKHSPAIENVRREAAVYETLGRSPYIFPYEGASLSMSPNSLASNNARSAFSGSSNVYFNMEHMEGSTLADYMKVTDIRLAEARDLITKTAKALRWLAAKGFTHGDIKLDNVYRDKTGKIRIFDFGSAKQFSANANMQHATLWDSARDIEAFVTWIITPLAPVVDKLRDVNLFAKPGTNPQQSLDNFYSAVIREYGEKAGGKGHKTRKHKKKCH